VGYVKSKKVGKIKKTVSGKSKMPGSEEMQFE
jgi:hypothetical protein